MELQVKDPATGALLLYSAKPEQWHGTHGFRIQHEGSSGFLIAHRGGTWQVMDDHPIGPELLVNIGLALEHYPLEEQTRMTESTDEGYDTDNQPNLNSGIGEEGLIDPNKP